MPDQFLTPRQVCDRLSIAMSTLYLRLNSGELPSYEAFGTRRIRESDLDSYLSRNRQESIA